MDRLDKLDRYLRSKAAHPNSMGLSDMDGFLTGVLCSPEPIPVKEWLDFALGDMRQTPDDILGIVTGLYEVIRDRLEVDHIVEPVFWEKPDGSVIAMDWCEGFMDAVKLRPERWDAFAQTGTGSKLMVPILVHILDENGNSQFGIQQKELDETLNAAAEAIPMVVPEIFKQIKVVTTN